MLGDRVALIARPVRASKFQRAVYLFQDRISVIASRCGHAQSISPTDPTQSSITLAIMTVTMT